jgi:putative ABC transport system permease protein
MPERQSPPVMWLARWLDDETRERCFAPAYDDLLAEHLEANSCHSTVRRLAAEAEFHLRGSLLVLECWRMRATGTRSPLPGEKKKGDRLMSRLLQDVRYSARGLLRSPGFAVVAVLTLALGIGANTAVFSVVDAVLLRPLPFHEPARLVAMWETNKTNGNPPWRVTPANYKDWRDQADAFAGLAAFGSYETTLTGRDEPANLRGGSVTANYFSVLGVNPVVGRDLQPSDETKGEPVALLGYGVWQSKFGGAQNVVGSSMVLDGTPTTIIGVMPTGIYPSWPVIGPRIHFQPEYQDVWVLLPSRLFANRRSHVLGVVGRLKSGVTLAQAQRQMDTVATRLEQAFPENKDAGAMVKPLTDEVVGTVRPALLILLAAVGAVLLIACSNVAGLLLARLSARQQEIAVRCALGAGRNALLRQFLAEGALLAVLGGGAGIWLAVQGQELLFRFIPPDIPRLADAGIDPRMLAVTAGLSLVAALVFALAPGWAAERSNVAETLRSTRGNVGARPQHLRQVLVVAQVSLAVVLTVAAGLLAQSFVRMAQVQTGFRPENLLVAEFSLPRSQYSTWQQVDNFYQQLGDKVRQIPGVQSAQFAYDHPLDTNWLDSISIEGEESVEPPLVQLRIVSPGYFSGIGLTIREGREFNERDDPARPGVAIVNEAFVRRYLPGGRALGRAILTRLVTRNWGNEMPTRFEIVGVSGNVQRPGLDSKTEPFFYLSSRQFPLPGMNLLARTTGDPLVQVAAVRKKLTELDPNLPVVSVTTMDAVLSRAVAQPRLTMLLMTLFGGLAFTLALVGVYGLVAFWVTSRTREIGVRLALGARPGDVIRLVLAKGSVLVLTGIVLGTVAALAVSRFLQSQLFGISALDPATLITVPIVTLGVGLLACLVPAVRATRTDPLTALRSE